MAALSSWGADETAGCAQSTWLGRTVVFHCSPGAEHLFMLGFALSFLEHFTRRSLMLWQCCEVGWVAVTSTLCREETKDAPWVWIQIRFALSAAACPAPPVHVPSVMEFRAKSVCLCLFCLYVFFSDYKINSYAWF